MTKSWKVKDVVLVAHKMSERKKRILVAEFSQMVYDYICQLYQNSLLDFSTQIQSCGTASDKGAGSHDEIAS